jgi:hypothetical protein
MFPSNSPVIVCGCHGGGTSLIAKLLRGNGVFMGNDIEPWSARKYHESRCFRKQNESFLLPFGDKCGFSEQTVRAFERFLKQPRKPEVLAAQVDLCGLAREYGCDQPSETAWGWKDPRNSLTAPIWRTIFPSARFVLIRKRADKSVSESPSGHWFRHRASPWLLQAYMNPDWAARDGNVLFVTFEVLVRSVAAFNALLNFCDRPCLEPSSYRELLLRADYKAPE